MLKHTRITHDRIRQFLEHDLRENLLEDARPIPTEFAHGAFANEAAARKSGKWSGIEPGFAWGPAYSEGWYRLAGEIPPGRPGTSWVLTYGKPEISFQRGDMVEGTIWCENQPTAGLDYGHLYWRLPANWDRFDLAVQTFAHNKETTVHRPERPRTAEPEVFHGFLIAQLDEDRLALMFDVESALDLLAAHDETDPLHAALLRTLNEVCNTVRLDQPKTLARARRMIKETLDSLPNRIRHTVTPVGHAHLDTAWLWPLSVTHLKMAHTTTLQLELAERYPEHVFVHSQASQYEWIEKERPELFDRVKRAVRKGQWEPVGSMWVEADCNLTGAESLVRQFLYGRRYFQQHFGTPTRDMWLPDVFGYSAALPQILNQFGITTFLTQKLSWNQINKLPAQTFWWVGIDGSRIWTHFPPADTYIGNGTCSEIISSVKKYKDHSRSDHSLYAYGFGDGGGGPTEFHLERLRRARQAPGMPVVESRKRAADFFARAREESHDLTCWVGELYFEMHRGTYTSQAANKRDNRRCEFLLRDAEWLCAFRADAPASYPSEQLEAAWKLVLLNQFHDIIPGSSVREVYEDSARDYAEVLATGEQIVETALRHHASGVDTSQMTRPIAIFQNSAIPSEASIPWPHADEPQSVVCGPDSAPAQVVEAFGERRLIFAVPDSALGAVAVADISAAPPVVTPRLKAAGRKLENEEFVVKFDGNGNITSIQSLDEFPTEFIVPGQLANLFQLLDDKPLFWDAWETEIYAQETAIDLVKSDSFEVVERGPARVAVELTKTFGKSRIRQRISLGPTPGIRFDTEVDWHEDHKLLKVAFPINVNAQRASFEIQFGHVERPTHRNTSWDVARFEVCAQKWADLSESGQGVALLNAGKYGHDVLGNVMRLSLLRAPKAPDPICDRGLHRFTYVLLPHYGTLPDSDVVDCAYAVNAEPRVAFLEPVEGTTIDPLPFLECDDRNIVVEAVKKAEDNGRTVVRAYECHNTRGEASLACARPIKRAWVCDLNEQPIRELETQDGSLTFEYRPFEILTFLLEF